MLPWHIFLIFKNLKYELLLIMFLEELNKILADAYVYTYSQPGNQPAIYSTWASGKYTAKITNLF